MLTEYTSYANIRVTLGLTTQELPDVLLATEIYDLGLENEVYGIGSDIPALYAVAVEELTDEAKSFVRAVRIFSTYSVARQCTEALPLFSSKGITDGKAGVFRDGNSPYKITIDKVTASYDRAYRLLEEAYADYAGGSVSTQTPAILMGISSPNFDPVTGA